MPTIILDIITFLNDLNNSREVNVGKIIKPDINKEPKRRIPITIVKEQKIASNI